MRAIAYLIAVLALAVTTGEPAAAQAANVGTLVCAVAGSQTPIRLPRLQCTFEQIPQRGRWELYEPTLLRPPPPPLISNRPRYRWIVFAGPFGKKFPYGPGVLAGAYSPASGSEPLVQGLGADALIGGRDGKIALVPDRATRLAAGVTEIELVRCRYGPSLPCRTMTPSP